MNSFIKKSVNKITHTNVKATLETHQCSLYTVIWMPTFCNQKLRDLLPLFKQLGIFL